MDDKEKKGKIEEGAEKTGEVVGKIGKKGWGVVKGFGKGVKKGFEDKKKDEKEE
ncbi:MAG: CsbD family protein [Candidatus Thermoplasmatota archaeon]|nr:CsbD family protein [Candidatus Thermoplasmatota archaeon]